VTSPRVPWELLAALYIIIFVAGLAAWAVVVAGPLDVIVGPAAWSVMLGLFVVAIGLGYGLSGRNTAISTMALILGAMMIGGQIARVLDFLAKAMGYPLADGALAAWDARMGLDWRAYYDWMADHKRFSAVLGILYQPTQIFVVATVILLTLKRLHRAAATFGLAIAASLLVCVVAGGFFPAVGPYGYFGVPDHGIAPWMTAITAVTKGEMTVADLRDLPALTTFPSYHSAVAILNALACWRVGRTGNLLSALNLLWLVGVPVWGDHYMVDVVAGVAIALICYVLLFRLPAEKPIAGSDAQPATIEGQIGAGNEERQSRR
jgi:hypothetical protein